MSDTTELAHRLASALGDGYVVERALGEGGFAVVFLVRDLALKRQLAVKVLSPEMITTHAVLERFRREAETVAQLAHPNIVPLHFIGEQDDLLYLAMQCVDGGSIADRLDAEGRLPLNDAVRVMSEVASALAYAHKRGVIHRDIKPANVLVDRETGRCLVTDFGIARTADAGNLTATGMTLGTPAYLAPEQVTGEALDHRIDIYALGVMAYEMMAGRLPFEGPTATAAMMKRLAGPPEPLSSVAAGIPAEVSDVVMRCLAPDAANRFGNAEEIVRALEAPRSSPARVATTRRPLLATAALAVLTIIATGAWWAMRARTAVVDVPADMITIPAGEYIVGGDSGLARPRHTERVEAFRIGRTEVTVAAYKRYVNARHTPAPWSGATPDSLLPVTGISVGDARNYCAFAYTNGRLPSEIEWEAAARGADARMPGAANTASAKRNALAHVASFPSSATPLGAQDMVGNVWEWTDSPLTLYPGSDARLPENASSYRVIRGGAYDTPDGIANGWFRGYARVDAAPAELTKTGFRCAVSGAGAASPR